MRLLAPHPRRACWLCAGALLVLLLSGPAEARAELSEAAAWLQGYLRIDTTNPPGGEQAAAAYLAQILRREGIDYRLLVTPEGRVNLWAWLPATQPAPQRGALLLLHHMDVVPPGPGWQVEPFAGTVRDGYLWGRGAIDAKGLGVAQLAALVDLKRRGVPLQREVILLAVADEENGGGRGTAWLLQYHSELFDRVEAVLNEGGSSRTVAGKVLWWGVEVAQKRPLWLEVRARGRSGHASGFNPHSAAHRLVSALGRLLQRPVRFRVSPAVADYFRALAPLQGSPMAEHYANIDRVVTPEALLQPVGSPNSFLDTVQVTVLEAGERINSVVENARAQLDVRLLPDTDERAFLAEVKQALGDGVEVEVLLSSPPLAPSPADTPMFRAVSAVLGDAMLGDGAPVVPAFIAGFTDSRYFRQRGIPAYGVWPFAFELEDLQGIHAADERVPLDRFDQGVERMRRIVAACVEAAAP